MADKICYWDPELQRQCERDATPQEQAEVDSRRSAGIPNDAFNAPILAELERIDSKSIRALREGNQARIVELESQAAALRLQLRKD